MCFSERKPLTKTREHNISLKSNWTMFIPIKTHSEKLFETNETIFIGICNKLQYENAVSPSKKYIFY